MKNKSVLKKMTAIAASLVITVSSVSASFAAYAADSHELPVLPVEEKDNIPAKYDLRNLGGKNYVTPVKFQNPFGTCWSFAAAAAAETTYLYQNGLGVAAGQENNRLDISEKHTAWYNYQPITKADVSGNTIPASQVGEGANAKRSNPKTIYDNGGLINSGFETYARYGGPVSENVVIDGETPFAYRGANKWVQPAKNTAAEQLAKEKEYIKDQFISDLMSKFKTDIDKLSALFEKLWAVESSREKLYDEYIGYKTYAAYDDWTLPNVSKYRLAESIAAVKDYKFFDAINSNFNNSAAYKFSKENLDAVKKEISSGHAMIVKVYGDQGIDDAESGDTSYMNTQNWAQYVNVPAAPDHGVTIVGYDDNYPREKFARKDNKGENDPTTMPPANGAFIVKNSYGCITEEDKKTAKKGPDGTMQYDRIGAVEFGYQNSGYYFISYYDMSLGDMSSVDLYKNNESYAPNAAQYDLLSTTGQSPIVAESASRKMSGANIFTSAQDEYLSEISTITCINDATIKYSIYRNTKSNDPESGELIESGTRKFGVKGYYRFALDKEYLLRKGSRYSVVIEQTGIKQDVSSDARCICTISIDDILNGKSIVNKGESFICSDGKWEDLTSVSGQIKQMTYQAYASALTPEQLAQKYPKGIDSIVIDNLPIRAYTNTTAVRFAGKNRYDTAARISSESGLFDNSDTVIIANGVNFADALAGVPLAAAYKAPILLTAKDLLPVDTANEIKRLGAKNAVILGGPGAVSETVEKELNKMGLATKRLSGQTRFATAKRVAEALEVQTGKAPTEVFFVIYNNFADALSASTVAAAKGAPILYVTKEGDIDRFTELYIEKNKRSIKQAYVIGGEGVITDEMKDTLRRTLGGTSVERVAGANRYATCVAVNEKFSSVLKGNDLCVAKGGDFPDALAGGVFAALHSSPLFLAGPVLIDTQISYLNGKKVDSLYVFGGTGAVPDAVIKSIKDSLAA